MHKFAMGFFVGFIFYACSQVEMIPKRSSEYSFFTRCIDNDEDSVCKYSDGQTTKLNIKKALSSGYIVVSKFYFFSLLKNQK